MPDARGPHIEASAQGAALRLTLAYALFAGLWIVLSDRFLASAFPDIVSLSLAGTAKGLLFVAVTSAFLFFLVQRLTRKLCASAARQEQLQADRARTLHLLELISNNSLDAIFAKDREGRYLLLNQAAAEFVGKPPSEVIGKDDHQLFPAEQAAMVMATDREVMETDHSLTLEERLAVSTGERVFLATKAPLHDGDGRVIGMFGISRDITARSAMEDALRDREEKLAAIVGYSPSALSLKTPAGRYAAANPNLQRIHGLSEAEIIGKSDFDLYPEEIARDFVANDEAVLQTRQRLSVEESVPVAGSLRTYMSHIFPVVGDSGQVRYICRISLDITERKQAEAEVRDLTEDLKATLHAIPDLLFELDAEGRYIKIEATAKNLLAAPAARLAGHTVREMLPPEAADTIMAALERARETGTDYGRTLTLPLADGDRHFELSVARKAVPGRQDCHFIVLSRDITTRMQEQLELRRSNEELARFDAAAIGRELQMIALKRQINELCRELGREPPYDLSFVEAPPGAAPA